MESKGQSHRLTAQQLDIHGVSGIFGNEAQMHDKTIGEVSLLVEKALCAKYPKLTFRHRRSVSKKEVNEALMSIDPFLGQTLFCENSNIVPDGGLIEVQDDNGNWRIILVSEAKFQGRDIENIEKGKLVGSHKDQDLMLAGNAIERSHKNIDEIANLMLNEPHFPYVLFLEGSNFLTKTIQVPRPDGRLVTLDYRSGNLNRLDRLTAANYGMPINTNLCKNRFVRSGDKTIMLQAASIFAQGEGGKWDRGKMFDIMMDVAETSLHELGRDLWNQINKS